MTRRLSDLNSTSRNEKEYLQLLGDVLRQDGWQVKSEVWRPDKPADLTVSRGNQSYVVALKVSSEGRCDRLVALLSQAILEAKAAAIASPECAAALAVIAAPSISKNTADELIEFRSQVAPDAAVGIFDREGLRQFIGSGLEALMAVPPRSARRQKLRLPDSANLFSDLNQWLLKVLLAPLLQDDLLDAPRGEYRNATELAEAAQVSIMSSFRFLRQLRQEEFLDEESELLRLVRRPELMRRWQAAYLRPVPERPLLWINPHDNENKFPDPFRVYNDKSSSRRAPIACLGLFAAAKCLGFKPSQGIPPSFYLEHLDREVLGNIGFSPDRAEYEPALFVRVPAFRESVFRAAVTREGVLVADIIQVWLDISSPPGRDQKLADQIRQSALAQIFAE